MARASAGAAAESDASALSRRPEPTLELDPPTANASAQARALDFVRVEGTKFFAGCDEYKIAGWNTYTLIEQAARLPVGSFEANFSLGGRRQVLDISMPPSTPASTPSEPGPTPSASINRSKSLPACTTSLCSTG